MQSNSLQAADTPPNRSASVYRELYGLDTLGLGQDSANVADRIGTVAVGVFDPWNRLYLSGSSRRFGGLPYAPASGNIPLEEIASSLVKREAGCLVDELLPAVLIQNMNESSDTILVYSAFSRPRTLHSAYKQFRPVTPTQAQALGIDEILGALRGRCERTSVPPLAEIDAARGLGWRYRLHDRLVRPIFRKVMSHPLRDHVVAELSAMDFSSLIDVSCGDDKIAGNLAKQHPERLFVANDISWATLESNIRTHGSGNVIVTNHNFECLPFAVDFDVVLFKNSLHHVEVASRYDLIVDLRQRTKRCLMIVDVRTPTTSSASHRLWNLYYRFLLKDQGDTFLDLREFTDLCKRADPFCRIQEIDGRNGSFMVALLSGAASPGLFS